MTERRKRGRPREHTEERVTTAMRLPKPLYRRLRIEAARRLVSVNLIIVTALEIELSRLERQKLP